MGFDTFGGAPGPEAFVQESEPTGPGEPAVWYEVESDTWVEVYVWDSGESEWAVADDDQVGFTGQPVITDEDEPSIVDEGGAWYPIFSEDGEHYYDYPRLSDGEDFVRSEDSLHITVETDPATGVSNDFATLEGEITDIFPRDYSAKVWFEWGESGGELPNSTDPQTHSTSGPVYEELDGLDPEAEYEFRLNSDLGYLQDSGEINQFTTAGTEVVEGGIMVMYAGDPDIPDGWVYADGSNGTPDMTDRFAYTKHDNATDTGGSSSHTSSGHNHGYDGSTDADYVGTRLASSTVDLIHERRESSETTLSFNDRPEYIGLHFIVATGESVLTDGIVGGWDGIGTDIDYPMQFADGSGDSPDARDRYVVCTSDASQTPGSVGGDSTPTDSHSHSFDDYSEGWAEDEDEPIISRFGDFNSQDPEIPNEPEYIRFPFAYISSVVGEGSDYSGFIAFWTGDAEGVPEGWSVADDYSEDGLVRCTSSASDDKQTSISGDNSPDAEEHKHWLDDNRYGDDNQSDRNSTEDHGVWSDDDRGDSFDDITPKYREIIPIVRQ